MPPSSSNPRSHNFTIYTNSQISTLIASTRYLAQSSAENIPTTTSTNHTSQNISSSPVDNPQKVLSPFELLKQNTKGKEDVISGSVASAISRFLVAPFDVLKIRFQLDQGSGVDRRYKSILGAIKDIYSREGVRGFWKGNIPATVMVVPYGAGAFYTQQRLKLLFLDDNIKPSPLFSIFSGSVAGIVGTLVSYPLDLLRTRLASMETLYQHSGNKLPLGSNIIGLLAESIKSRGIRGLYDGLTPALIGIVPYMGFQFGIYDASKYALSFVNTSTFETKAHEIRSKLLLKQHQYHQNNIENIDISIMAEIRNLLSSLFYNLQAQSYTFIASKGWEPLVSGGIAGASSKFLTMPFDVIKKRYQIANFPSYHNQSNDISYQHRHVRTSFLDLTRSIYKTEGLRAFYKGLSAALLKTAPASAITFSIYEACTLLLKRDE